VSILAVLVGALLLTGLLTYVYRSQRQGRAIREFREANELAQLGRDQEAVERYRNALSVSHSAEHRLALALELVKVGRLNEATVYLGELLRQNPDNAPANLGMARVAAGQGQLAEAVNYYNRAIYGAWPADAEGHRRTTRFELASLLAEHGARKQAVSELLALLSELPETATADRRRIGGLLQDYGATVDAVEVFRDLLRRDPRDAESYQGLGRAEFTLGRYAAAQAAFRNSLQWNPNNEQMKQRLAVCDEILALDPTLRGLSTAERYRRSRRLVESTLGALEACLSRQAGQTAGSAPRLAEAARNSLARTARQRPSADARENNLSLAEELWAAREKLCGPARQQYEALSLVMAHLAG
jgi:tetratricopeptide (TPR) repeat protein